MRILLLANNWVGWQLTDWLRRRGEEIAAVVVHPPARRKFGEEIVAAAGVPPERVICGTTLGEPQVIERVKGFGAEIGVSLFFDFLLAPEFLRLFRGGCINLHPSWLPHNRGLFANVWSIVERTRAGATLHYMDEGADTGDIIGRREVAVEPVDTGESLYRKLERACVALFEETWPTVRAGRAPRTPQPAGEGSFHRRGDVERIDRIDLEASYRARDLIDILRARTFPPYRGAWFEANGRRVYVRVELSYGEGDREGNENE